MMTERSEGTEGDSPTSVPLTWDIGGPVVGSAKINPDGTVEATVTDPEALKMFDSGPLSFSIQENEQ